MACLDSRGLCIALGGMGKGLYREKVLTEFLAQFHGHISFVYVILKISKGK